MNWIEFTSEDRDGLFIVDQPDEVWIGYLYYRHKSPFAPYGKVFVWGAYCGDDSECVDDEDMDRFEKSTFFEIPKDSELFREVNGYLETKEDD